MLIRLVEIYNKRTFAATDGKTEEYSLREVFVNPEHVVCLRENDSLKIRLSETKLGKEIHSAESFTKVYINRGQTGLDLDVVGDIVTVQNKLAGKKR
jgi:hypothetical protein|tara:strand:+ start:186 stop:476 length:291 start_codon:yes stop_codon:yes gene_type:complete